ncbi:MAG: sulfurtransferase [Phycisphaeraceae bacterium]|nr:sulfurtransferase [Phycisphaeraceae bacterium]
MKKQTFLYLLFCFAWFQGDTCVTAKETTSDHSLLVTTQGLADHLKDPSLVILHIGRKETFEKNHIPGARLFSLKAMMTRTPEGNDHELASITVLDALYESVGISNDSNVIICYDSEKWAMWAGFVYVGLDYVGMGSRTFVLDGGLPKWMAEKRATTSEVPAVRAGELHTQRHQDMIATTDWLEHNLDNPDVVIVDARGEEAYTGTYKDKRLPKHGHITGAFNLFYWDLMTEKKPIVFKRTDQLESLFSENGMKPGALVVPYCDTGIFAAQVYFVAKHLGYETRFYDASFQEWSRDDTRPVTEPVSVHLK